VRYDPFLGVGEADAVYIITTLTMILGEL